MPGQPGSVVIETNKKKKHPKSAINLAGQKRSTEVNMVGQWAALSEELHHYENRKGDTAQLGYYSKMLTTQNKN